MPEPDRAFLRSMRIGVQLRTHDTLWLEVEGLERPKASAPIYKHAEWKGQKHTTDPADLYGYTGLPADML